MKISMLAASLLILAACSGGDDLEATVDPVAETNDEPVSVSIAEPEMLSMSYDVINASGNVIGQVSISDVMDGVSVDLNLTAIPEGAHAVHFHEFGRCDLPDFTSAGGHYNPAGVNHGFESAEPNPHAGDMPNITAPVSGMVSAQLSNDRVSLSERDGFAPLFDADGTALIIHADADDYMSQPTGAAGGRIACAMISR